VFSGRLTGIEVYAKILLGLLLGLRMWSEGDR
jgi:hypothetical protein